MLLLPAQPLLQFCKGQSTARAPGHDLSIRNELTRKRTHRGIQLGKLEDLVQSARIQFHLIATLVRLGANAIVLIFQKRSAWDRLEDFARRLNRSCQHTSDRVEQAQLSFVERATSRKPQGLADITEEHVRTLNAVNRRAESLGDRFFDQVLFQADAEIAGDDLDDVFRFQRIGATKQLFHHGTFLR